MTEEWAFSDPRRFGRITLKNSHPLQSEPLVSMGEGILPRLETAHAEGLTGRDTLTDMPHVDEVRDLILKRKAPIKAVLMDQRGVRRLALWVLRS